MTTIKEFLKNVERNITDDALEYFSVIIEQNEPCGEIMLTERKAYIGSSDHEIIDSEQVICVIPRFGG